jgi:hypothetical protein
MIRPEFRGVILTSGDISNTYAFHFASAYVTISFEKSEKERELSHTYS